jgi:hypothetical protein
VVQDVLTLHGAQFKDADLIVASPPCQFFSYTAMPWSRAKALAAEVRASPERLAKERALFDACFRIQREACAAAGRHIPMVVENVRGAIPWVGRSKWNYGSYHLWGDVPALMPPTGRRSAMKQGVAHRPDETNFHGFKQTGKTTANHDNGVKVGGSVNWHDYGKPGYVAKAFNFESEKRLRDEVGQKNPGFRFDGSGRSFQSESVDRHTKNTGGSWFAIGSPGQKETGRNPDGRRNPAIDSGTKTPGRSLSKGAAMKFGGHNMGTGEQIVAELERMQAARRGEATLDGTKQGGSGAAWFDKALDERRKNPDGVKVSGINYTDVGFNVAARNRYSADVEGVKIERTAEQKRQHIGTARAYASAMIAKIPEPLSRHIARVFKPQGKQC